MIPQTTRSTCYRTFLLLLCALSGVLTLQGGCAIVDLSPGPSNATVSAIPPETIRQLRSQGISDAAFKQFFKVLARNKIPPDELDARLRKMAELYRAQKTLLMQVSSEDPEVASLLRLAREAVEIPEFSLAEEILNAVSQRDEQAARDLPQFAKTLLTSAAGAQVVNGNLQVVQLNFVKAQAYYRKALTLLPSSNKEYRGGILVNLAHALADIRSGGENPQNGLREAVATYRLALTLLTKEEFPQQWASTQKNLAFVLSEQGRRVTEAESTHWVQAAETAYREALTVYTKEQFPQDWALIQNGLGGALANQGFRTDGEAGAQLLAEAVQAYREALTVDTKDLNPLEWARTQSRVGNALSAQARRVEGKEKEKTRLFGEAVQAYREALTVLTREHLPVVWALTQYGLGNALNNQGFRTSGEAGAQLFAGAVQAYREALTVDTKDLLPLEWPRAQLNLGIALWEQARRVVDNEEEKHRLFVEAVQAYREALTVYSKNQYPQDWAMTQARLGKALGDQGFRAGGGAGKELLHQAINAFELALEVWTREAFPVQWEETMGNLKIVKKVLNDLVK